MPHLCKKLLQKSHCGSLAFRMKIWLLHRIAHLLLSQEIADEWQQCEGSTRADLDLSTYDTPHIQLRDIMRIEPHDKSGRRLRDEHREALIKAKPLACLSRTE